MRLRAPTSRRRPNRLLEELEDSDGFNSRAYSPAESSTAATRSSSQPVQIMDRRLRPAFPPPTKPFNPDLPPAAFPSLPLVGPGSNNPSAPPQDGNTSKSAQRQDSVAPLERQVTVLRYRTPLQEETMHPDDMNLIQLARRDYNIERYSYMFEDARVAAQQGQSRLPEQVGLDFVDMEDDEEPESTQSADDTRAGFPCTIIRFVDLHQLMRATIIINVLSESIKITHAADIFYPLQILLRTPRFTFCRDLNYAVDIVLQDQYPNILGDLQPQMRRAESFLRQHRLPVRFLYAFGLGSITEILHNSNAHFAVLLDAPVRSVGAFIAPCGPLDLTKISDRAHQGGWKDSPSKEEFPLGGVRDASVEDLWIAVVRSSTYETVADYSQTPWDQLPSPFLRKRWPRDKPFPDAYKALTESLDSGDAVKAVESNATDMMDIYPAERGDTNATSTIQSDAVDTMDICAAKMETVGANGLEQNPTDHTISEGAASADPANDMAFEFDEKLDIFEDMPSPIRRGLELSVQPGAAPMSSLRDREFPGYNEDDSIHGIFYGEEQTEFYPGVRQYQPAANSGSRQAPIATDELSPVKAAKVSGIITAPIDFTEVFQDAEQAAMYKRNWVLNHLLGLGEEIREATLRNDPVQRGGEDVSMGNEWSKPMIESYKPQTSPDHAIIFEKSSSERVESPTTATPMRKRQASDGYFPRSLRSLPPRYALPRRSFSLQDLDGIEASPLPTVLQSSPATIVAVPESSPGILPPCSRPQPLEQQAVSRRGRGRPLKRVTVAGTPRRIEYQEPSSSAATISMIDPSPGIVLPRNCRPSSRNQNCRGERARSPRTHTTKPKQPSIMCSSSSSAKSSSSTEPEISGPPVVKSGSFLHETGSDPPLASFRLRSNLPEATPTTNTTLVVSNKGRDSGYASVRTTLTGQPRPNNKNSKDLGLDTASLPNLSSAFPISAPAFSNIRLPNRAFFDQATRSAPLPLLSNCNAPHEVNARVYRSPYSPFLSGFPTINSSVNPMHPVIQPALNAPHPSVPTALAKDNASRAKAPGQNKRGAKIVNVAGRHRGGGKYTGLLTTQALERNLPVAMQSETELPHTLVSDAQPLPESRDGGDEEEHGEPDESGDGRRSPSINSISTVSSGGSSGDEEFERQKRLDEENKWLNSERRRSLMAQAPRASSVSLLGDDMKKEDHGKLEDAEACRTDSAHTSDQNEADGKFETQQKNEDLFQQLQSFIRVPPTSSTSSPIPPFPPCQPGPFSSTPAPTLRQPSSTPSPNRLRSRSRLSMNAAGQLEANTPFTRSALSPHRQPRPPGDEMTPGIRAAPRKRKLSILLRYEGEKVQNERL